ncbi:Dyp-type peroxidase family protein [Mycolicibacterium rhodesiae JS60]|nr:Dyp-type peroxidase family protein [Mycolicibacterium rhodesiae JS60]
MKNTVARYLALPILSAGIIGGALGVAGAASAAEAAPQPGIVATPQVHAKPAAEASPGYWWHRHHPSLLDPRAAANFRQPGV